MKTKEQIREQAELWIKSHSVKFPDEDLLILAYSIGYMDCELDNQDAPAPDSSNDLAANAGPGVHPIFDNALKYVKP